MLLLLLLFSFRERYGSVVNRWTMAGCRSSGGSCEKCSRIDRSRKLVHRALRRECQHSSTALLLGVLRVSQVASGSCVAVGARRSKSHHPRFPFWKRATDST